MFPGTGLYCKNKPTCSLGTIADVTFFYG
jgi:hypothetical protein